jgi:hypothetical protein
MKTTKSPNTKEFKLPPKRKVEGDVGALMQVLEQWDQLRQGSGMDNPAIYELETGGMTTPEGERTDSDIRVVLGPDKKYRTMPRMVADPSSRTGQRKVGDIYWDDNLKKWQVVR